MEEKDFTEKKNEHTKEQLVLIGKKISSLRKEKGYTNYEIFAYDNNISRSQMGRYEKGEDMRLSSLIKLLVALDVSLEDFFKGFKEDKH